MISLCVDRRLCQNVTLHGTLKAHHLAIKLRPFEVDRPKFDAMHVSHRVTGMKQIRARLFMPGIPIHEQRVQNIIHDMIIIMCGMP